MYSVRVRVRVRVGVRVGIRVRVGSGLGLVLGLGVTLGCCRVMSNEEVEQPDFECDVQGSVASPAHQ